MVRFGKNIPIGEFVTLLMETDMDDYDGVASLRFNNLVGTSRSEVIREVRVLYLQFMMILLISSMV